MYCSRTGILYSNGNSTSGKYSKEDIESLNRHRKDKYPHLMLAILAYVLETGCSPDGADIDDFGERGNKALAADREEAAQDNCIWASMEWRWQEHANRPKRSRRNGQRQRLTARLGIKSLQSMPTRAILYYFLYSPTYIDIVRSTILVTTYVGPFSPQITNSCKTSSPGRKY